MDIHKIANELITEIERLEDLYKHYKKHAMQKILSLMLFTRQKIYERYEEQFKKEFRRKKREGN